MFYRGGVNYSLEERVIGTWVDGKPLYQQTVIKTIIDGQIKLLDKIDALAYANAILVDTVNGREYSFYDYLPMLTADLTKLGIFKSKTDTDEGVFFECNKQYGGANTTLTSGSWQVRVTLQYTK